MPRSARVTLLLACTILAAPTRAPADDFGNGPSSFSIDFVTIANPGNVADTTGSPNPAGSVPYIYRIGKYEISEQMIDKANALGALGITKDTRGPDKPATSISWFEAAQFVNWLNTSAGHAPAYKFDASGAFQLWQPTDPGYNATNLFRNTQAKYFLPTANEWYKAAYFDPTAGRYWDFATGSDAPSTSVIGGIAAGTAVYNLADAIGPANVADAGGLSPSGTMAQGGNIQEWEETAQDLFNDDPFELRIIRGGGWGFSAIAASFRFNSGPSIEVTAFGFRVASIIPEPHTAPILASGLLILFQHSRRQRPRRPRVAQVAAAATWAAQPQEVVREQTIACPSWMRPPLAARPR